MSQRAEHRQGPSHTSWGLRPVGRLSTLLFIPLLFGAGTDLLGQGVWSETGRLAQHRDSHTATLLPNGKVLVVGGEDSGVPLSSAELYDPAGGSWTATGSLATARYVHTATLLPNGKVLVAGGFDDQPLSSAELYDPVVGAWTTTNGPLNTARFQHTATLLPSGKVLIAGGASGEGSISSAELYDPVTGTWTTTGSLTTARQLHTATLLPTGKVLVAGGYVGVSSAELYDPATETWSSTGSLAAGRSLHTATLLPTGKVLVAGGFNGFALSSAELYNPSTGVWTPTGSLSSFRKAATATLLPAGKVLVAGGSDNSDHLVGTQLYDPLTGAWTATGELATKRVHLTATLLPGGSVLVAGGYSGGTLSSVELYDAGPGAWTPTGASGTTRERHTATLLKSGKVLVTGGYSGGALSSTELYDPTTGDWSATGSLSAARDKHTATLLPNGTVLVTGGDSGGALSSAELYDPVTGTWATTAFPLGAGRYKHTATLLANGKVLVAGGFNGVNRLSSTELYDPVAGTWAPTGSLSTMREDHTATLLPNGRVLVAAGYSGDFLSSAELYDPDTGAWTTTGSIARARRAATSTLLPSGRVLMAGGLAFSEVLSSAELYDPAAGIWTATGSLSIGRTLHAAILLPGGKVLVAAGTASFGTTPSAEVYNPATGLWRTTGSLTTARSQHVATLLPTGKVLVEGGSSPAELYDIPQAGSPKPVLEPVTSPIAYGTPIVLSGTLLGGGSEASGGGTRSSAVNYPLFEMRSVESGQVAWLVPDGQPNFSDDPMTVTITVMPPSLDPGWNYLTPVRAGIRGDSRLVLLSCSLAITTSPADTTVTVGERAMFAVAAQGGRHYQWQENPGTGWIPIGGDQSTYLTERVTAQDSGTRYRVLVTGACSSATSAEAVLTISDSTPPTAEVVSPSGGEYWLLSTAGNPSNSTVVTWSMSDNIRVCSVAVSLLYSDDGGSSYTAALSGGGLPETFGTGGSCLFPGETTTNLVYTLPLAFPSGKSGSLYKIQIVVTDHAGNVMTVTSTNPFYIVQANPDSVKTLILSNIDRMMSRQGISLEQATLINGKLQELADHPRVQGLVIDIGGVTSITNLYSAWDAETSNTTKANTVLFGPDGIHDYVRTSLLAAYSGVKYLVLVGDDRIIPMARMQDHTVLLPESSYPAGGDLTVSGTTVGQALAAGKYLTDDPLAVMDEVPAGQLDGNLFLPDLAVGRLVETPQEIVTTIATYIGQDGILDLSLMNPSTGHKVLVTGYDFLSNVSALMRARWKSALGVSTGDTSLAPVDGSLVGGNWGLGSVSARSSALRTRLSGNGGARYGVMGIAGHATHYEEGVPGTDPFDIQGLSTAEIYGADSCATPTLGALDLSGGIVYALGCHGGLSVAGSCRTDADRSLDLPQTMLSRGIVAYIANSGYGWGLKFGIGYGSRLTQIFTEQMTNGGTIAVGDAVRQSKQRYYLETPRYDPYDEKTVMQWTLYGLPMYAVKTGIAPGSLTAAVESSSRSSGYAMQERLGAVRVTRHLSTKRSSLQTTSTRLAVAPFALPAYLTQLNLSFDFTGNGVYVKHDSAGNTLPAGAGCPDANGCYYTLNGLVDRGTGSADLPIQPYLIYDSRLSGTSQHGVLWKGGTYDEEPGWTPVIAQLVSNGGDGSNHGSAPRVASIRPTAPRIVPGVDAPSCRPSDLELNSLTLTAGEAVKNETADLSYSIARRYRKADLEVFYFNNPDTPADNCDRTGPALGTGPFSGEYHQLSSSTLFWAVPATDTSGVWRVVLLYNRNTVDGQSRGTWTSLDLTDDGSGTFYGNASVAGTTRLTYIIQAVDNRGNVTWLDYVSAQLPSSGVPLGIAEPVDVTPGVLPCTTFTITPALISASSGTSSRSVSVGGNGPAGCLGGDWTAAGNGSWVTVSPTAGNGGGEVLITWGANATGTPRSATITVAGASVEINQSSTPVTISAGSVTGCSGATVTVPISLAASAAPSAIQFDLVFDSTKLSVANVEIGTLTSGFSLSSNVTGGRVRVAMASGAAAPAANGEIGRVTFQVLAGLIQNAVAPISIENVLVDDVVPSISGGAVSCTCPIGDVNANGSISAFDASLVLQIVVGSKIPTLAESCAGDFNRNGSVSAFDAALILQCIVGSGPCS